MDIHQRELNYYELCGWRWPTSQHTWVTNLRHTVAKWSHPHLQHERTFLTTFCVHHLKFILATTWQNQQNDVRLAKTQISLGIRPVWSVFAVRMKKAWVLSYPLSAQRRLWSDWADAQADPSLRWAHSHFVGFVMRRLILFQLHCLLAEIDGEWSIKPVVININAPRAGSVKYNLVIASLTLNWYSLSKKRVRADDPRRWWSSEGDPVKWRRHEEAGIA